MTSPDVLIYKIPSWSPTHNCRSDQCYTTPRLTHAPGYSIKIRRDSTVESMMLDEHLQAPPGQILQLMPDSGRSAPDAGQSAPSAAARRPHQSQIHQVTSSQHRQHDSTQGRLLSAASIGCH